MKSDLLKPVLGGVAGVAAFITGHEQAQFHHLTPFLWCILSFKGPNYHLLQLVLCRMVAEKPGRVAQLVGHLTRKSGALGSIPGLATYFRFSFRFFKKGS